MTAPRPPFRVLFVCMGNICRSPAAEIIFRHLVAAATLDHAFEIDSAGTIGYHRGSPPDPRMAETLRSRGYAVAGSARQIRASDLEDFDLILVADRDNLTDVQALDGTGSHRSKIRLITDYCLRHDARRVPDPYYGGRRGFEEVADLLEDACAGLLDDLRRLAGG